MMKDACMYKLLLVVCLVTVALPLSAFAEIKTITHNTVQQPFAGSQSPDDARIAGIARAKLIWFFQI